MRRDREDRSGTVARPDAASEVVLHRIVIVGGGAGGLELAVRLGDTLARAGRAQIVLVDETLTHVWKPLLHELAAGTLPPLGHEVDFLQQAYRHRFRFHPGRLETVDRAAHQVRLAPLLDDDGEEIAPSRALPYDTLVLALGSVVNDFGTPGVLPHANRLDTADDARRFHRKLLAAFARAELRGTGPVEVVIVGGGATGVELASELVESVGELARYGVRLKRLERPVHITVVEAGERLVAALTPELAARVHQRLVAIGVSVRLQQAVTEVAADHVKLKSGETLPADLTVWAAGIQGPPLLAHLADFELNRSRQIVVRPTLQTTVDDDIYAMGDCASCVPRPGAPPVPPRAQAAHQQAIYLAGALAARLDRRPWPDFVFHERGSLVSLGTRRAVGDVAPSRAHRTFVVKGALARWSYWALHRQHMATLHGWARMLLATVGGWLTARTHARVKLH